MDFYYTQHWVKKRIKRRQDITDYMIEYCIVNSNIVLDKYHEGVYNAIGSIPPSNRLLKVVYKTKGKTIKILTAYWLH